MELPAKLSSSENQNSTEFERAHEALARLVTSEGVRASGSELFSGGIFGRDGARVGLDIIDEISSLVDQASPERIKHHRDIVDVIIRSLIKHQGVHDDLMTEEQPGRIHHEARYRDAEGHQQHDLDIHDGLVGKHKIGIGSNKYVYYGTVDATLQFIRLIDAYRKTFGDDILQRVERRGEESITVEQAIYDSAVWVSGRLEKSDIGLLEFQRTNPHAPDWQVLRDGTSSYMHEDGRLANPELPIASIETQGLAYDALQMAASTVGGEEEKAHWRAQAEVLRAKTFELFWLPEKQYWAMAVDRYEDEAGVVHLRTVETETSLPAELLETGIFENLPEGLSQEELITPIVRKIFSDDFLTSVGMRMRSKKYTGVLPYIDYQGLNTVWMVSDNIIANGLRRYGLYPQASLLERISLAGEQATAAQGGNFLEFKIVDDEGMVLWPLNETVAEGVTELLATDAPQYPQAWIVSAYLRMLGADKTMQVEAGWQQALTNELRDYLETKNLNIVMKACHIDKLEARRLEAEAQHAVDTNRFEVFVA